MAWDGRYGDLWRAPRLRCWLGAGRASARLRRRSSFPASSSHRRARCRSRADRRRSPRLRRPHRRPRSPPAEAPAVDDETFAAVTVLMPGEIEAQPAPNIGDVTAQRPGIAASTFAPGASRPIIRGLDNYRVRVQENGVGTHDVSALSEDHAVTIDPFAAERIEIIRGPATLRYGSQAIGGVVDVSNGRIPDAMPDGGFSAVINGGLNSVDRGHDGGFKVDRGCRQFRPLRRCLSASDPGLRHTTRPSS